LNNQYGKLFTAHASARLTVHSGDASLYGKV
jgi:hypothetical protein